MSEPQILTAGELGAAHLGRLLKVSRTDGKLTTIARDRLMWVTHKGTIDRHGYARDRHTVLRFEFTQFPTGSDFTPDFVVPASTRVEVLL